MSVVEVVCVIFVVFHVFKNYCQMFVKIAEQTHCKEKHLVFIC